MAKYFNEVNPNGPLAGTKCPVSPGRLRELYEGGWREEDGKRVWCEPMGTYEIAEYFSRVHGTGCGSGSVLKWLKKCGVQLRSRSLTMKIAVKTGRLKTGSNITNPQSLEKSGVRAAKYLKGLPRAEILRRIKIAQRSQTAGHLSRRIDKVCGYCKTTFSVPPSEKDAKYCSHSCSRNATALKKIKTYWFSDIWCPRCLLATLRKKGFHSNTRKPNFSCFSCGRNTVTPLLEEPTPRQVLERHRELRAQGITLREVPALEGK